MKWSTTASTTRDDPRCATDCHSGSRGQTCARRDSAGQPPLTSALETWTRAWMTASRRSGVQRTSSWWHVYIYTHMFFLKMYIYVCVYLYVYLYVYLCLCVFVCCVLRVVACSCVLLCVMVNEAWEGQRQEKPWRRSATDVQIVRNSWWKGRRRIEQSSSLCPSGQTAEDEQLHQVKRMGRFGCTHASFQRATPHTPHHDHNDTHNTTRQSETEGNRERRQKEREERDGRGETRQEKTTEDETRRKWTRQDKRRRDKTRRQEKMKEKRQDERENEREYWRDDQEIKRKRREIERWKEMKAKILFRKWELPSPPDELDLESSESYRVFHHLHVSNWFFRTAGINWEKVPGRIVWSGAQQRQPQETTQGAQQTATVEAEVKLVRAETPLASRPWHPHLKREPEREWQRPGGVEFKGRRGRRQLFIQRALERQHGLDPWRNRRPRSPRHCSHEETEEEKAEKNMVKNMCAWCRHTRGRFERTHGGFSSMSHHTPHTTHHTPHTPRHTPQQQQQQQHRTTHGDRQTETEKEDKRRQDERQEKRRRKRREEKEKEKEKRRDETRRDETRREDERQEDKKTREDERREDKRREKMKEKMRDKIKDARRDKMKKKR